MVNQGGVSGDSREEASENLARLCWRPTSGFDKNNARAGLRPDAALFSGILEGCYVSVAKAKRGRFRKSLDYLALKNFRKDHAQRGTKMNPSLRQANPPKGRRED